MGVPRNESDPELEDMLLGLEIDNILQDCFFAVGQAVGTDIQLDPEAALWWRDRYHKKFKDALRLRGNSWDLDRPRVMAVGRYLGARARLYAGEQPVITLAAAARASVDVERGCQMNAEREAGLTS